MIAWTSFQVHTRSIISHLFPIRSILDGMSGCGVRALRYLQEADAGFVWINDADPDVASIVRSNLSSVALSKYVITHTTVQDVLGKAALDRDYFDVIDLDAFGNPLKFVGLALQSLKIGGLLYITSTDGRSLSGQLPDQSVRQWGSVTRSHPAVHEQALRVLIGAIAQQALTLDYGIAPVIAYFAGPIWRVMVRLLAKPHCQQNGFFTVVNFPVWIGDRWVDRFAVAAVRQVAVIQ
jgi:tRNA (guanine26-N2/guanine27-N2)-dimethyltransferase